jgi:hypothetical protein
VKSLNEWIQSNIRHNENVNFDHIQDEYLKSKLKSGLIRYDSEEWAELAQSSDKDEKELRRKGVN